MNFCSLLKVLTIALSIFSFTLAEFNSLILISITSNGSLKLSLSDEEKIIIVSLIFSVISSEISFIPLIHSFICLTNFSSCLKAPLITSKYSFSNFLVSLINAFFIVSYSLFLSIKIFFSSFGFPSFGGNKSNLFLFS